MTSGAMPCLTQISLCQLCGNNLKSSNNQVNYEKQIDPPRSPYTQILPDSRYEEDEMNEKRKKGKICEKNKNPPQICITIPVVPGKNLSCCNNSDKKSSSKVEDTGKEEKPEKKEEKSNDSALMKASCLPVQGCGQPIKMMLCLPCPPPKNIENQSSSQGKSCKPRDYTYRCESRELRMGNLYSCCQCIKRNGLQDDCPRTPCQGRPACLKKPWPDCWPSGGCHGIDFTREKGTKRYDPCREQRFDKKECNPPGGGGKSDCGGNMMVVVCPPCGKK